MDLRSLCMDITRAFASENNYVCQHNRPDSNTGTHVEMHYDTKSILKMVSNLYCMKRWRYEQGCE